VLRQLAPGSLERAFDFGQGPRRGVAVSWADVVSAYYSTGIGDVTVYFEATPAVRMHTTMVRAFGWAVPYTPWQSLLHRATELLPEGPSPSERQRARAVLVGEARDGQGRAVRARLRTPEAYSFTATTATAILARVLAGDLAPGLETPGRLYGPDFVLSLPGVTRQDL
jgi:short subunit dehydrogenase-like uncharacterized protein